MKKRSLIIVFALVLICATVFSSAAIRIYRDAYDSDTEPTIRVRASLQGVARENSFTKMTATLRFDVFDDDIRPPSYTYLNMVINAQAENYTIQTFTESGMVQIGDYISLTEQFSEDEGITILRGSYYVSVIGATISFNPDSIVMTPSSQSEVPDA